MGKQVKGDLSQYGFVAEEEPNSKTPSNDLSKYGFVPEGEVKKKRRFRDFIAYWLGYIPGS